MVILYEHMLGQKVGVHVGRLLLAVEDLHFWHGVQFGLYLAFLHIFVLLLDALLCASIEWALRLQDFDFYLGNIAAVFDVGLTLCFLSVMCLAD